MSKKIIGAGGGGKDGGGSARVPNEAPDSLQSRAFARVIDLVSEGEIEGLVNGLQSVYLNETPVLNPDGTNNFSGVKFETRNGTQAQSYLPGFNAVENENSVGIEARNPPPTLGSPAPVVRTISKASVDAVRVRVSFPQLTNQNPQTGDLTGTIVEYAIDVQSDGGSYVEQVRETVNGKSTSKYERAHRVDLTGPAPWNVRLRKITQDSTTVTVQNKIFWESYTEIIDAKLRYPNSALVAIEVDSTQFTSIPSRAYELKLLKVRVPSNTTTNADGSLSYSGSPWNGNFRISWTTNPAWILYDLLTSQRYGLGGFIPEAQVDKWGLYSIGRYCDERVSDGRGGLEPRYSCSLYLQSREEAFNVISNLCSVFRGMAYWAGGSIVVSQDAPSDPTHLFTSSNVIDGAFTYSGSSSKTRHTVALVSWNDPEDFYRQKVEYVEDQDAIARYGINETSVTAFGCTSRGQAHRLGKWLLYSERFQTEVVNFKTGLNGATCRPGQIIKVQDPARAGSRLGGRIVQATTTQVTIDGTVDIDPTGANLSVLLPDGSIEERPVQTAGGNIITVSTPFSVAPQPASVWMLASAVIEPQLFKVVGVSESSNGVYDISALAHNPEKFDFVENDIALQPRNITTLTQVPEAPTGLLLTETLYEVNADVRVKVTISWNPVVGASSYLVKYQREGQNIIDLPATRNNEIEILNAEPGIYTATVYAVNPIGARSVGTTATRKILGKSKAPGNVTGFSLMPLGELALLSWDKSTDLDVLLGGTVRIRHSPQTTGALWRNSVDIVPALSGNANRAQAPLLSGTYMAKFVDSSNISSDEEAVIVTTIPESYVLNVVETLTEHPGFIGTKTAMEYNPTLGGLTNSAGLLIDDILDPVDTIAAWDFAGGVAPLGTYNFSDIVDLGSVFSSKVTVRVKAQALDVADAIDLREENVDDWLDLDGDFIDTVNAEIFLKTTEDDPNSLSAVWTEWKRFFVGEYKARGFQFQLRLTSTYSSHNMIIEELAVTIDMPDRVENLRNLTSGAATYSVTFTAPFHEVPSLGITGINMISGDYYQITNKTRTGFDITFRNAAGAAVSRNFDVLAKGYGRQS